MKVILGAGLAGLSLAHFLKSSTIILEKESQIGGLCRSFDFKEVKHDIGPHILFSKNEAILKEIVSLIETNKLRRSNKIFHKNRLIKYPFENDLASLDEDEKEYCLKEFIENPYENYEAKNMLQFFLKTFGEGITRLYLQPYNEKIWKFDPSFMDTQMVERIPKPPREDIINSARGIVTEGYTHQLFFHYPKNGGIQQLIEGYANLIKKKSKITSEVNIISIRKKDRYWFIETDKGTIKCNTLINCMPLQELFKYLEAPKNIQMVLEKLNYNSIYIVPVLVKKDNLGDNFALNFADKSVIFHRISKLNFLGKGYCQPDNKSTLLVEITFRPGSYIETLGRNRLRKR